MPAGIDIHSEAAQRKGRVRKERPGLLLPSGNLALLGSAASKGKPRWNGDLTRGVDRGIYRVASHHRENSLWLVTRR